jgi:4-hydroxybenzoate polyprenyltransferase
MGKHDMITTMSANGPQVLSIYLRLLRLAQWLKNGFIFLPLVFSQNLGHSDFFMKAVFAFFSFSFMSSAIYIINDIHDRGEDQYHPEKKIRPLASGQVKPATAAMISFVLLASSLLLAGVLPQIFYAPLIGYLILQALYTFWVKKMVILDALSIALGFLLRVIAGALCIQVPISSWLLLCTFFLALFLAFCKRRHELSLEQAVTHRPVLEEYSEKFLDQLITATGATTILCYALYAISHETVQKFHTPLLVLTLPFVVYGVYRYMYLTLLKGKGGNPSKVFFADLPFALNFTAWGIAAIVIVYWEKL